MRSTFLCLAVLSAIQRSVYAFSFTAGNPTECDDMQVTWAGGTPPFQLLMTPVFGTPRNISIPGSAFVDGKGSFSVVLPFEKGHRFILTMSDSTAFGSGGSTPIFSTGSSLGGSCETKDPGVSFEYQLNTALQQCRPYVFSQYSGGVQPVTIMAIIPGGQSFILSPPRGPTSYSWIANVRQGNSLIFVMIDSLGRQGGSSNVLEVGPSDDSTCLDDNSPSSTATSIPVETSSTSNSSPTSTPSPSTSTSAPPASGTPVGAILGTILGSLIFLAVSVTLGLFLLRRRRERNMPWDPRNLRRNSHRIPSQGHLVEGTSVPSSPYHYPLPNSSSGPATARPFLSPADNPNSPYPPSSSSLQLPQDPFNPPPESTSGTDIDPFNPPAHPSLAHESSSAMSAGQRKAAMAGSTSYKPSRFILHTDIEDTLPPPNDDGVIELPPQYSARGTARQQEPVQHGPQWDSPS